MRGVAVSVGAIDERVAAAKAAAARMAETSLELKSQVGRFTL